MSVVFLDESGPAPPQLCWERYAVPAAWPAWAPQIRAVEVEDGPAGWRSWHAGAAARMPAERLTGGGQLSGRRAPGGGAAAVAQGRIVPGLRGRIRGPFPLAVRFVITAVDEVERTWSWRVRVGPLWLRLDHGVDACLDGGTAAWLRITAPAPVIRAYAPVARAALRHLVAQEHDEPTSTLSRPVS